MDKLVKKCVRELGRNKNVDENLVKYTELTMHYNVQISYLKLAMEYYMFYESVTDELASYTNSAKYILDAFNSIIKGFFEMKSDTVECQKLSEILLDIRKEIISKMQVLTVHVDCFVIYEYIFNRLQYRFDAKGPIIADDKFIETVINYIFGTRDNVTINENIRFIVGQVPMRMLRSKYFDIIRESVFIYKGGDVDSLKGFEYMFRTNAMLYKDKNMDIYFKEFQHVLDELESLDYDNISEDVYRAYLEKANDSAKDLTCVSDLYMQLGNLVNAAYIIIAGAAHGAVCAPEAAETIIRSVNSLFTETGVGEDKLSHISGFFDKIMGQQEEIRETIDFADAVIDETLNVQQDAIKRLELVEKFTVLKRMSLLDSSSTFAELDKKTETTKVTAEIAEETAARLISEIKELFKNSSKMLRRAVMASTMDKMPVFLNNPQEVADYISSSIRQCDDEAEKYASKEIIMDAIQ